MVQKHDSGTLVTRSKPKAEPSGFDTIVAKPTGTMVQNSGTMVQVSLFSFLHVIIKVIK